MAQKYVIFELKKIVVVLITVLTTLSLSAQDYSWLNGEWMADEGIIYSIHNNSIDSNKDGEMTDVGTFSIVTDDALRIEWDSKTLDFITLKINAEEHRLLYQDGRFPITKFDGYTVPSKYSWIKGKWSYEDCKITLGDGTINITDATGEIAIEGKYFVNEKTRRLEIYWQEYNSDYQGHCTFSYDQINIIYGIDEYGIGILNRPRGLEYEEDSGILFKDLDAERKAEQNYLDNYLNEELLSNNYDWIYGKWERSLSYGSTEVLELIKPYRAILGNYETKFGIPKYDESSLIVFGVQDSWEFTLNEGDKTISGFKKKSMDISVVDSTDEIDESYFENEPSKKSFNILPLILILLGVCALAAIGILIKKKGSKIEMKAKEKKEEVGKVEMKTNEKKEPTSQPNKVEQTQLMKIKQRRADEAKRNWENNKFIYKNVGLWGLKSRVFKSERFYIWANNLEKKIPSLGKIANPTVLYSIAGACLIGFVFCVIAPLISESNWGLFGIALLLLPPIIAALLQKKKGWDKNTAMTNGLYLMYTLRVLIVEIAVALVIIGIVIAIIYFLSELFGDSTSSSSSSSYSDRKYDDKDEYSSYSKSSSSMSSGRSSYGSSAGNKTKCVYTVNFTYPSGSALKDECHYFQFDHQPTVADVKQRIKEMNWGIDVSKVDVYCIRFGHELPNTSRNNPNNLI